MTMIPPEPAPAADGQGGPARGPDQPRPQAILTPPAPRRCIAAHNTFTSQEAAAALGVLSTDLAPDQVRQVEVTFDTGRSQFVAVEDVAGLREPEHVKSLLVDWAYRDGSHARGFVVHRLAAASLSTTGEGQARAAAIDCIDYLASLRPGRAARRRFFLERSPVLLLWSISITVVLIFIVRLTAASVRQLPVLAGTFAVEDFVLVGGMLLVWWWAWGRWAGTRLERSAQVQRRWLTAEVGVLATIIAALAALLALVIT